MAEDIVYLTKEQTGLPFDVVKDDFFDNYLAKYERENAVLTKRILSLSDLISIHLLVEIRNLQAAPDPGPS